MRLASVETSSVAYLASLTKGQVILLHGPVTLPQSQELLALPLDQPTGNMSIPEVLHEVIPSDLSITLVVLVGRVPAACCTLELEGRERDVVLFPDCVRLEVLLDFCQPVIRLQRVSSFCESGRDDSQKLLKGGVVLTFTPLAILALQQLHDCCCALGNCCQSLSQHRGFRWRYSHHPEEKGSL